MPVCASDMDGLMNIDTGNPLMLRAAKTGLTILEIFFEQKHLL